LTPKRATTVPKSSILSSRGLFQSNEADVLREMNAFIGGLPQRIALPARTQYLWYVDPHVYHFFR